MIRFSCPHCGREYALADFMARLPLLCKGCGQHLDVPEPTPEPPPVPKLETHATPVPPAGGLPSPGSPQVASSGSPRRETPAANDDGFLSQETLARLDVKPPAELPAPPPKPAPPPLIPAPRPAPRKLVAIAADAAVVLVLLGLGVLLGEFAARKPTAEILENASGPRFPPTDVLVWLGGPVLLLLIYAWLGSRGWTLGGWLKRRSAA